MRKVNAFISAGGKATYKRHDDQITVTFERLEDYNNFVTKYTKPKETK